MKRSIIFLSLFTFNFSLLTVFFSLYTFSQSVTPFLTLNTDMHTGTIKHISTDAQGKYILTCSYDKTAKLWNAADGSLIRTYRIPIEEGPLGLLLSCALSPDGNTVALGGYTNNSNPQSIYLFNSHTGIIFQSLRNFPNVIYDLEFSMDGKYLAAAGGKDMRPDKQGNNGIYIYERGKTENFGLFRQLTGYGEASYNITFDRNGRLATVCNDGKVRLYSADFSITTERQMQEGTQPYSLAFSPDCTLLAVGYDDSPIIEILDGNNLKTISKPDVTGADKDNRFQQVSFSNDGKYLFSGGYYHVYKTGELPYNIRRWSNAGNGGFIDIPACSNTIMDIKPLPDGSMLFCSAYPEFGRLSGECKMEYYRPGEINDYRSEVKSHFTINDNGAIVGFKPMNKSALVFSVTDKLLLYDEVAGTRLTGELIPFTDSIDNIIVTDWLSNYSPKVNGKTLPLFQVLDDNGICRSVDIDSLNKNIVFGSSTKLVCINSAGDVQWNKWAIGGAVSVNISGNSKTVAIGNGDGMIEWFRMSDGKLLLTLFAHPDNKRWILYTPLGYYDCSPGAEELIGWHVNNFRPSKVAITNISKDMPGEKAGLHVGDTIIAIEHLKVERTEQVTEILTEKIKRDSFMMTIKREDKIFDIYVKPTWDEQTKKRKIGVGHLTIAPLVKEASYYPADRFFETYYRPELIQEIFKNYETDVGILTRWGNEVLTVASMKKPPQVKITSPGSSTSDNPESVSVIVEVTDQGGGIDEILLFQNGKLVETTQRGFKPLEENGVKKTRTYQLTLGNGENRIKASAFSTERIESNPDEIILHYAGAEKSTTLYLFVLGINNYKNSRYNLNYARADAQSIMQSITVGGKSIFRDVKVYELYDEQATRPNIQSTIKEITSLAGQNDLFVFFYAGHGTMSEPEGDQQPLFYLIPTDVTRLYGDNEILKRLAISALEIRDWCRNIKAQKQLIMMDACQSGGVVQTFSMRGAAEEKAILQLARSAGVAVLASTGNDQLAAEFTQIGHGVFTYAVVDGLTGNADGGTKDKKITVKELEAYINDLIPELTKKYRGQAQYPNSYSSGMDFPVILVK